MDRIKDLLADDDDGRLALRTIGGLLLGIGMVIVAFRRSGSLGGDAWGDGALFAVIAAASVFLIATGWLARADRHPWQSVFLVFGLILVPAALFLGVDWIDEGASGNSENIAWIFAVTAALGVLFALRAGARACLLLAGLAAVIAWLALGDVVLSEDIGDDLGTMRALFVSIGVLICVAGFVALRFRRLERNQALELVTAGGLAIVVGASLVTIGHLFGGFFFGFGGESSVLWDLVLLLAALGLILVGSPSGSRGPQYVGGAGLLFFVYSIGFDLDDDSPAGKLIGWPLIVLVAGAVAFLASFWKGLSIPFVGAAGHARERPAPPTKD